ncbi:hypothetical protein J6590_011487 [Homalodisca vitripennis]|nr:hypothetical protein J6590_011487 [Homalodisca vitripennis]
MLTLSTAGPGVCRGASRQLYCFSPAATGCCKPPLDYLGPGNIDPATSTSSSCIFSSGLC